MKKVTSVKLRAAVQNDSKLENIKASSCKQQALDNCYIWDYIRVNRKDKMKVKEAAAITGSMTRTSKMPGLSYSLPAWECKTGSKLRKIKNSVCSMCYALKGNYTGYKAIKAAQYVRLASLKNELWTAAIVTQIKRQNYFRWHDACLLYTSPSPRDRQKSRMPSSA